MKLPWKVEKKIELPSDKKLEEIKNLLFPQLQLHEKMDETGTKVKFHVDYSVDSNLDAALMDLEEGHNDAVTQKTIRSVIDRLIEVRRMLEAYPQLNEEAKYIIVDDMENKNAQDIEASETEH